MICGIYLLSHIVFCSIGLRSHGANVSARTGPGFPDARRYLTMLYAADL
jgi:hypothetical protein